MNTVAALSAALAAGKTTSRELLEQVLARIADPAGEGARAFLKLYADTARAEADLADRLRKSGIVRSPVDGLPISVKDLYDVAGDVTRAGSKVLAIEAKADAPAVARLRAAGAIVLGRTNMVEFAFGAVNPEFVRDGLESIDSDEVVLKLISPLRPGLLEPADGGDFSYLVMPIRLNV